MSAVNVGPALAALERALNALDTKDSGAYRPPRARLDAVNFDGTDCTTVEQFAAANRKSELGAAVYALDHKSLVPDLLYRDAVEFVKDLHAGDPSNASGVAVVFTPSRDVATQLAVPGGEPAGELHITLGYFGDVRNFQSMRGMLLGTALTAHDLRPFDVQLNGITRFTGQHEDALVVNADSPVLPHAHRTLHDHLKPHGIATASEHGYSPHLTLGYLTPDDDMPIRRWTPVTVSVSTVELWFGRERIPFSLDEDLTAYLDGLADTRDADFPNRQLEAVPDPGTKDVHGGGYPGEGGVPIRGRNRKRRRAEIIERAQRLSLRKVKK